MNDKNQLSSHSSNAFCRWNVQTAGIWGYQTLHSGIWSEMTDFKIPLECYTTSKTMTENVKIIFMDPWQPV